MTTIAWDGVSLCSDSLLTSDRIRSGFAKKIFRLVDGGRVGVAGQFSAASVVVDWLKSGRAEKPNDDLDFAAIWIQADGSVWCIESDFNPYPMSGACAIGSGSDIALAALTLGKTAREAVELAIKLDCMSGGDIDELVL